ncbi:MULTISPECIES: RelA/SpoT family protein [Sphingomonadaceae]|jgi:GTP diphosphokinase / guanosine-3',5'-bis(diphosphate) 3'-diphosphatase|uniref:RelA/SpoT family protein n=1 Tax=Sphingomonadales TaxID=204457 RepID=UPI0000D7A592|nr:MULTISPECIES: bifunctional (p)ppGpp synthetase/guanosine-3',5'-bis(diphosphate) 3'-pyrophosphohydrolase [Sphingomonadaceae]EAT09805.1 (p)ppGpp synthetase I (GTP pyrophosphokinase), SpoT/RelA [Sphingomonas sp. SKA58]MBS48243.1 bifunctional (p)ppGpp synthetase/guanosine-3',5'-bis(diphosphate) 3'-pyrophosphohydrolase [Sphingobium sp.]MCC4256972.1 bifunctional (p)ppGpp synthetase/guanosine-3',5'-bis(diphosphate) 3'-pyrophosphohydrolase [Sphingobium lactosutens]|tara:strand:+ start:232 stop:2337 length:2106 start_codon:yes stop_codon:yes gene_type:complete
MLRQYELVERVKRYDPEADEAMINRAYVFSVQKHGSQKRASGDPYFSHPIEVAGILTDFNLDDQTIVTALLHDTIEDTLVTYDEIESAFGPDVARMVDGVTKLSKIEAMSENERAAENLRKFLLAMSDDIRVLLVKLADRLHNMRTLHFIKNEAKRRRIARETMDIYAPLAERIGMYDFMREMQLLAFRELEPEAYDSITRRLEHLKEGGHDKVDRIGAELQLLLGGNDLSVTVSGREKHPYSIWRKMQERHISFEQLTDVMAFRVITDSPADCYRALGIIHQTFKMVPGRFKDYISTPKRNGYRSLHTTVIHQDNARIEVQIRSRAMHSDAELGLAAHWAYKQKGDATDHHAAWLRDLVEILEQSQDADELLEHTRMAMYQDRIFAFTPKGELHQLPKGSTPVDFAYAVHTSLGNQTVGAKVNGRVVPLRTSLDNGDQVEILKSEGQEPQPGWLSFAITGKARAAIRRFIRQKQRGEEIKLGEKLYEEIIGRFPADLASELGDKALNAALKRLKLEDRAALMVAIATHRVLDHEVMEALVPGSTSAQGMEEAHPRQHEPVSIRGLTPGIAYNLGDCCHPVPGDRIVGVRRTGEPIEVHTIDCRSLEVEQDDDWVDLSWDSKSKGGTARLSVIVKNQPGALAAVANVFGATKANILNLQLVNREGPFHTDVIDLEVADAQHLMRILSALRAIDVVVQADRV